MKNIRALGLLLLALLVGLAAAFYAAGWVSRQGKIPATRVVVAASDLQLGSRVSGQLLTYADWPAASLPEGSFNDVQQLQDRVLKSTVLRGEPILEGKLAPQGTRGGLSAVIAEGKRAMTVRVNDVVGVAGFALPGNYVDVMVNTRRDGNGAEVNREISKTVLEKVLVLAVAQEAGRDDTKPKVVSAVTLELAPEDAEKLDLARSIGSLSLVLRNQVDQKTVQTGGATKSQLLGGRGLVPVVAAVPPARPVRKTAAPAAPRRPSHCVEIIDMQNVNRSRNCFE